jgi:hypothetical protein
MLGYKFEKAFEMAANFHGKQTRKCSDTPYISHLMSVAAIVMEHGGDQDTVVAALLHDSIEDCSAEFGAAYIRMKIANEFGPEVLAIIEELTETDEDPKPDWRIRKEKYMAHLRVASSKALLVAAADKLHNARTTLNDLREKGATETWSKFNADPLSQFWWYNGLMVIFQMSDVPAALVNEISKVVDELFESEWRGPEIPKDTKYRDILKMVEEYNGKLRCDHPGFSNGHSVYLEHFDGVMMQRSAFYQIWNEYIVVFGEHMPPQVHHQDEITHFAQFTLQFPERSEDRIWVDEDIQRALVTMYRKMQWVHINLNMDGSEQFDKQGEVVAEMLALIQSTGLLKDE